MVGEQRKLVESTSFICSSNIVSNNQFAILSNMNPRKFFVGRAIGLLVVLVIVAIWYFFIR